MQTAFDFEPVFFGNVLLPVYDYTAHGDGSEFTLRRNRQAFDWVDIVPVRAAIPPSQVDLSSELLGVKIAGLDETTAAEAAITEVERLRTAVGIPNRLREIGAKPEQLAGFAEKAFAIKRVIRVNPRVPTLDDFRTILETAY